MYSLCIDKHIELWMFLASFRCVIGVDFRTIRYDIKKRIKFNNNLMPNEFLIVVERQWLLSCCYYVETAHYWLRIYTSYLLPFIIRAFYDINIWFVVFFLPCNFFFLDICQVNYFSWFLYFFFSNEIRSIRIKTWIW